MFRRTLFSGHLYLWISWLILLAIYLTTVFMKGAYGGAVAVLLSLLILYYAEGMEIAVATLADKQEEQIDLPRAKRALQIIKGNTEWFFAQRQVFVVTIVTFMSLMTNFDVIYVPFYAKPFYLEFGEKVSAPLLGIGLNLPFLFTLVFTTFTILWWCQVFPKRLALRNSVRFLHQSALLMTPIRGLGALNLPGPADQLVWLATRYTIFSEASSLKPSRAYYYDTAAMLYGFATDRVLTRVSIRKDGSAIVTQKVLLLFIHGGRTSTTGGMSAAAAFSSLPNVNIQSIHTCPRPEKLELITPQLDQIFDGQIPTSSHTRFTSHDPVTTLDQQLTFEPTARGPNQKKVVWTIEWGKPLPGALWKMNEARILVVLAYEVTVEFDPNAFTKDDYFIWAGELPCRRFSLRVQPHGQTKLGFGLTGCTAEVGRQQPVPFPDETDRITQVIKNGPISGDLELEYPMQGTSYRIDWRGWLIP